MKVEGNNLTFVKEKIAPADWVMVFESTFNIILYRFLANYLATDRGVIHYASGSGHLASLLIQTGFEVIGIESDEKYRIYSLLMNTIDFKVFENGEYIKDITNHDLILHPLFWFFDSYKNLVDFLFSFLPKLVGNDLTIISVLLFSDEVNSFWSQDINGEFLVLSSFELSELFKLLHTLNISMEVNKTGECLDAEKKVEQVIVTFSSLP